MVEEIKKLNLESKDLIAERIEKLKELFPEIATEGDGSVDFEKLRLILGDEIEEGDERYAFTWPGKMDAIRQSQTPSKATLRPCIEKSRGRDGEDGSFDSDNLYIEGDNLEVLKLLQRSYHGKVKMIYIDPPYNTGSDFVYKDSFSDSIAKYKEQSGLQNQSNADTSGSYHASWCSMMYPRLRLARELLRDDGAIFISIDDNEVDNLKTICSEIFGEDNFVAAIPWRKRTAKSDVPFGFSQDYEQIVIYAKSKSFSASVEGKEREYYLTDDFPGKPWRVHDMTTQRTASERPNSFFTITNPKTGEEYHANPNRTWAITSETFNDYYLNDRIVFPGDYSFLKIKKPTLRYWKDDDQKKAGKDFGRAPVSTKLPDNIGMSKEGTKEITSLFGWKAFSYPKPSSLIKYLTSTCTNENDIVLDFFSGSGTTAHAAMDLNAKDGGNRKFILVQLPETTDPGSEAFKNGYETICGIGEERIRRAGDQLKEEVEKENLQLPLDSEAKRLPDIGFRVLKLDESGIVEPKPGQLVVNLVKDGRSDEDIIFEVMLKWGYELTYPIERNIIEGYPYYSVAGDSLICCMDKGLTTGILESIAKLEPDRVFILDSAFAGSDSLKLNAIQIFKRAGEHCRKSIELRTV